MANAPSIRIAQAVADEINRAKVAGYFQISDFEAKRSYADWDKEYSDLAGGIGVDVVLKAKTTTSLITRTQIEHVVPVHIAVRHLIQNDERDESNRAKNEVVDPLINLQNDIYKYFAEQRNTIALDDVTEATWDSDDQVRQWVDYKLFQLFGAFEGYVQVTFRMVEAV